MKRIFGAALSVLIFSTQVLFAHMPEKSIWDERKTPLPTSKFLAIHPIRNTEFDLRHSNFSPYASIRSIRQSKTPNAPIVIYIQDIHGHLEAQRNIGEVISHVLARDPKAVVGMEGSAGRVDWSPFRQGTQRVNKEVGSFFRNTGLVTGAEYAGFAAKETPRFYGVEDADLYLENVAAVKAALGRQKGRLTGIASEQQGIQQRKKNVFSSAMLGLDEKRAGYHSGAHNIGDYLVALAQYQKPSDDSFVGLFLKTWELENKIDFDRADRERGQFLGRLAAKLSKTELSALMDRSAALRAGTVRYPDYYRFLRDTAAVVGVSLSVSPEFDRYIQYVIQSDAIQPERLLAEFSRYEKKVWLALCENPEQINLYTESAALDLKEKLVRLTLTYPEWVEYRSLRLGERTSPLRDFERFYELAEKRNAAMVQHFREAASLGRGTPAPTSVLVAGGFHSEGLVDLLVKNDVTVITLAPKLTNVDKSPNNTYLDVFTREKTPLEKLFAAPKISLPATSSVHPIGPAPAANAVAELSDALKNLESVETEKAHVDVAPPGTEVAQRDKPPVLKETTDAGYQIAVTPRESNKNRIKKALDLLDPTNMDDIQFLHVLRRRLSQVPLENLGSINALHPGISLLILSGVPNATLEPLWGRKNERVLIREIKNLAQYDWFLGLLDIIRAKFGDFGFEGDFLRINPEAKKEAVTWIRKMVADVATAIALAPFSPPDSLSVGRLKFFASVGYSRQILEAADQLKPDSIARDFFLALVGDVDRIMGRGDPGLGTSHTGTWVSLFTEAWYFIVIALPVALWFASAWMVDFGSPFHLLLGALSYFVTMAIVQPMEDHFVKIHYKVIRAHSELFANRDEIKSYITYLRNHFSLYLVIVLGATFTLSLLVPIGFGYSKIAAPVFVLPSFLVSQFIVFGYRAFNNYFHWNGEYRLRWKYKLGASSALGQNVWNESRKGLSFQVLSSEEDMPEEIAHKVDLDQWAVTIGFDLALRDLDLTMSEIPVIRDRMAKVATIGRTLRQHMEDGHHSTVQVAWNGVQENFWSSNSAILRDGRIIAKTARGIFENNEEFMPLQGPYWLIGTDRNGQGLVKVDMAMGKPQAPLPFKNGIFGPPLVMNGKSTLDLLEFGLAPQRPARQGHQILWPRNTVTALSAMGFNRDGHLVRVAAIKNTTIDDFTARLIDDFDLVDAILLGGSSDVQTYDASWEDPSHFAPARPGSDTALFYPEGKHMGTWISVVPKGNAGSTAEGAYWLDRPWYTPQAFWFETIFARVLPVVGFIVWVGLENIQFWQAALLVVFISTVFLLGHIGRGAKAVLRNPDVHHTTSLGLFLSLPLLLSPWQPEVALVLYGLLLIPLSLEQRTVDKIARKIKTEMGPLQRDLLRREFDFRETLDLSPHVLNGFHVDALYYGDPNDDEDAAAVQTKKILIERATRFNAQPEESRKRDVLVVRSPDAGDYRKEGDLQVRVLAKIFSSMDSAERDVIADYLGKTLTVVLPTGMIAPSAVASKAGYDAVSGIRLDLYTATPDQVNTKDTLVSFILYALEAGRVLLVDHHLAIARLAAIGA